MKAHRRALATLALMATTIACVKAPPAQPEPDVEVRERFEGAPEDAAPAEPDWWAAFADPGLTAAIETALAHNRDLRAAAARVDQAAASARIAGADLKPSLELGVDGLRRKQNFIGFPIPGSEDGVASATFNSFGVSLDVAWEVDLWGRLRSGARAALADLQAAQADFAGARLSLAGQTAKAWIAVAEASRQLDVARRTAESWRDSNRRLELRYRSGLRSPLDVRLARSSLADAEALVQLRERQLDAAARQIATLLGRYPDRSLALPGELPDVPERIPAGLPADLIGRRPDLVSAERRLAARDQRLVSARAALYPRLVLTGSAGTATAELADLVDGDFSVWSLVAGLAQPLFQGGRLRAGVDLAEAGRIEAIEDYAATALRAYAEVESALAADRFLAERVRQLRESVAQSERALELAEERYDQGLEDYVTVLESRRGLLLAETGLVAARRERIENRIDLFLALGGGFRRPDDDGSPAPVDPEARVASTAVPSETMEPEP